MSGSLLRIFQWRDQPEKGTSGRKGKVEKCTSVWGSAGPPQENFGIFELPRLLLKGTFTMGPKPFSGGANTGAWGGGGALAPSVYILKEALGYVATLK